MDKLRVLQLFIAAAEQGSFAAVASFQSRQIKNKYFQSLTGDLQSLTRDLGSRERIISFKTSGHFPTPLTGPQV